MISTSFKSLLRSIIVNPSFRSAFFAFALTRAIVLGTVILAANAEHQGQGPAFGQPVQEVKIYFSQPGLLRRLGEAVTAADALWYLDIARNGYEKVSFNLDKQHNWAFFPLYPFIVRTAAKITGEFPVTAALLSNIFFFFALVMLHKTALRFGVGGDDADRTVFYLAGFPTSYFFSFPFTESLFLLLTVSSFFCAKRDLWWRAGVFGALASATRLNGLLLVLPLAVLYWQRYRTRVRANAFSLLMVPLGLFAYMLYLRSITGNALAFMAVQSTWGRNFTLFLQPLWDYLRNPLLLGIHWDFRFVNFLAVILAFICIGVLLRRRQWALGSYALVSLIVPLSASFSLQSLTRYVGVIFPIFFVLGEAGRRPRLDQVLRAMFIVLLGLLTAMFALRIAIGMA
jgi:Gpi18-like mannosyltransferase